MRPLILVACIAALALTACNRRTTALLGGGAIGGLTAKALEADDEWIIVSALAGAGVGSLVARNSRTGECAYKRGRNSYTRGRCR